MQSLDESYNFTTLYDEDGFGEDDANQQSMSQSQAPVDTERNNAVEQCPDTSIGKGRTKRKKGCIYLVLIVCTINYFSKFDTANNRRGFKNIGKWNQKKKSW